jgi:hypothetical protein
LLFPNVLDIRKFVVDTQTEWTRAILGSTDGGSRRGRKLNVDPCRAVTVLNCICDVECVLSELIWSWSGGSAAESDSCKGIEAVKHQECGKWFAGVSFYTLVGITTFLDWLTGQAEDHSSKSKHLSAPISDLPHSGLWGRSENEFPLNHWIIKPSKPAYHSTDLW